MGLPLVGAVEEYVECRRRLGSVPLLVAVESFATRKAGFEAGVTVPRVVEEFLRVKEQDRVSNSHLWGLRSLFRQFVEDFPGPVSEVTSQQIEAWIRRGDHSVTTRNNWMKKLKNLFGFAKRCGYLPKSEPTAAESLKRVKVQDQDVGIFSPGDMRRLMAAASEEMIPFLAIGGFSGLRVAEIGRLDWDAVNLERRIIELRAGQAKTASRRIVPMSENLAAWLAPLDRRGAVIPDSGILLRTRVLARSLGINWPHNVLRHSYISYRIADVQNAAQVALEAGNSPAIIFKHYRELVTPEEAGEWFGIYPAGESPKDAPGAGIDSGNIA